MSKLKIGTEVSFKGYTELEEGQKPVFTKGDKLKITKVIDEETFEATSLENPKLKDSVFEDEVEVSDATEEAAAPKGKAKTKAAKEAPAAEAAAPKIKKGAKKAAPAEAPPAEATAKGKGKAKVKGTAKPKAAPKPVEELEILPPEAYTQAVQKVTKSATAALKAAKSLVDKIGQDFWTLGGILSFIRRNKSYKTITDEGGELLYDGKLGFAKYAENELQLAYRKAMYYIEIYEAFAPLGIDESRLLAIGWSKAKELSNVVDKKNVNKWLDKAEEMGREDLQAEIKTSMVKAGEKGTGSVLPPEQRTKMTKFTFKLFEDQGNVALEALSQAKEAVDGDDNAAFAHIASEWLSLNSGDASTIPIDEAFKLLENRYSLDEVKKYAKRYK